MIIIIDGNNLAHRAKHVFSLSNYGTDVSVTYGFLHTLKSYITRFKADSVIVCWDGGIPEFRRIAVPEYKATRNHGDPDEYADFIRQLNELDDILQYMGVISVRHPGAEADDLMYHAAQMVMPKSSVIITNDKDLLQACSPFVSVFNPTRETLYTMEKVSAEIGVPFADYIYWRALQGDSSDNIPGVPGIGDKTATKLFKEFGEITKIVNAANGHNPNGKISGKMADNINSFGFDRIFRNVYVMALYADRVGARIAVENAVLDFQPAVKKRIKKYLLDNGFVSLISSTFVGDLCKLIAPNLNTEDLRMPVICDRKYPL